MIPERFSFTVIASTREEIFEAARRDATAYFAGSEWEITEINAELAVPGDAGGEVPAGARYKAFIEARLVSGYVGHVRPYGYSHETY